MKHIMLFPSLITLMKTSDGLNCSENHDSLHLSDSFLTLLIYLESFPLRFSEPCQPFFSKTCHFCRAVLGWIVKRCVSSPPCSSQRAVTDILVHVAVRLPRNLWQVQSSIRLQQKSNNLAAAKKRKKERRRREEREGGGRVPNSFYFSLKLLLF